MAHQQTRSHSNKPTAEAMWSKASGPSIDVLRIIEDERGLLPKQVEVEGVNQDLTLDLDNDNACPYFLWSEEMDLRTLKEILAGDQGEYMRWLYSGRILREAKMKDVWRFFKPAWINENWPKLSPYLGRKRNFWRYCLDVWSQDGLFS